MPSKFAIACALSAACIAVPALAHSDYLLQIPPEKGEMSTPIEVDSWSFGACDSRCSAGSTKRTFASPRDSSTGQATGKTASAGKPVRGGWDLATGKGGRMASPDSTAADLSAASNQDEIYDFTLSFSNTSPALARFCRGKHIATAKLSGNGQEFDLSDADITCSIPDGAARQVDSTPARISTNRTGGRESSAPSMSERCSDGSCGADALTDGLLIVRFTSGQMKHTKTGHVTLMK